MCESWGQLGVQGLTWDLSRDPIQELLERFTVFPLGPEECLAQLWFPTKQLRLPLWHHNRFPLSIFSGGWVGKQVEGNPETIETELGS